MKTANNNRHGRLAQGFQELCKATRPRIRLILLIALAISATCSTSFAQTIIGSPGGGQDTLVYFKRDHEHLRATLQLQLSTIHTTNSAGLRLIQRAQRSDPSINSSKGPEFRPEVWCHPQSEKKSASSPPSILA